MDALAWKQADVARKLEMTSGGVNQIVKGKVTPTGKTMALLRMVAAQERPDLFGFRKEGEGHLGFGLASETPGKRDMGGMPLEPDMLQDWRSLEDDDREHLRAIIKSLSDRTKRKA